MSRLPHTLFLGRLPIRIALVDPSELDNGNLAQYENETMTIKVSNRSSLAVQAENCIHEFLHAVEDRSHHEESQPDEEERVRCYTWGVVDLLSPHNFHALILLKEALETPAGNLIDGVWAEVEP